MIAVMQWGMFLATYAATRLWLKGDDPFIAAIVSAVALILLGLTIANNVRESRNRKRPPASH